MNESKLKAAIFYSGLSKVLKQKGWSFYCVNADCGANDLMELRQRIRDYEGILLTTSDIYNSLFHLMQIGKADVEGLSFNEDDFWLNGKIYLK